MYQRPDFSETRREVLVEFIRKHGFPTLVSVHHGEPFATRLPMLLTEKNDALILEGHIAINNPQWQSLEEQPVMAIFDGPHCYVSPNWYDTKGEIAPTWNYVTVHAYGKVKLHKDSAWLGNFLRKLIDKNEAGSKEPWNLSQADPEFIKSLFPQIVGIELSVKRLEGKFKLNQNRTAKDRDGVIEHLSEYGDADGKAIARLMEIRRAEEEPALGV